MKILLVYPKYPDTFWSFKHALKFVSKKAANPPLGLLTVASLLPFSWGKRLVDMNIESLNNNDILWADMVFVGAMNIQKESANEVIERCQSLDKKIIAGGPLFTEEPEKYTHADHLVLNEAEITLPLFLDDLVRGKEQHLYHTTEYADMSVSPVPDYSLIKSSKYNTLSIQYTRGCPFNCEFCDITALLGHKVRYKSPNQIIAELNNIYNCGWRKSVFFVDDNFIGNIKEIKRNILPAIIDWMDKHGHPFTFTTEASINLADDNELMDLMADAGFATVFIGIETTDEESLVECGKKQNSNRDVLKSVRSIQDHGIEVSGGFIVGFDNDKNGVFRNQIDFIQSSGIISAMVGLLGAPKKTRLYKRLKNEGRLLGEISGDNTDLSINFVPKMNTNELLAGYKSIIRGIYSGNSYYRRVKSFLMRFEPNMKSGNRINSEKIFAFIRSFFILGIYDSDRWNYWKLIGWSLFKRPKVLPLAITYSVYGYHFRKIFRDIIN